MCIVSMVHDHYTPQIPDVEIVPVELISPGPPLPQSWIVSDPAADLKELKKLIADFREAVEAAKKVDELTNQPDCLDPKKAKLEERIQLLEQALDQAAEFRVTKGQALEPGVYRVVAGKLYRVIEDTGPAP